MLTMQSIDETGFGLKVRDWNSDELLVHWREQWAHQANTQLAEAGEEARIDHRTLAAQRAEAQAHALSEPEGERRDALAVRAAEMDREPSPYLRASWYMEQKARASAEAAGTAYEPVTDRGGWLAEDRTIAAERLEAVRVFAQELAQRASQTWRHWTGQDREEVLSARTDADAAERLQRGREAAQVGQSGSEKSSAAELLQRAGQIAQAGQGQGVSGSDRLQRARRVAQDQGQVPTRPRDGQGQE
jgi:hypothetical protein